MEVDTSQFGKHECEMNATLILNKAEVTRQRKNQEDILSRSLSKTSNVSNGEYASTDNVFSRLLSPSLATGTRRFSKRQKELPSKHRHPYYEDQNNEYEEMMQARLNFCVDGALVRSWQADL